MSSHTLVELNTPVDINNNEYTHKVKDIPGHDYWLFCKPKYEGDTIKHLIVLNPDTNKTNKIQV